MILIISPKNVYASKRLIQEAKKLAINAEILGMAELIRRDFKVNVKNYNVLYVRNPYVNKSAQHLPELIKLAKKFKAAGKKVVDANIADGNLGMGKWVDYKELMKAGLPIPSTRNYELGIRNYEYPFVLKWQYGMKASNIFLIHDKNQLTKILKLHPKKEWLVQEFVAAEYEYKVITVGYKALPVVLRFAINPKTHRPDFEKFEVIDLSLCHPDRPNASEGAEGSLKHLKTGDKGFLGSAALARNDKVREVSRIAETASKLLGRELAKVDILEAKGKFYILEVNRFPGLESFESLTKFNVVKVFMDYLQR